jgi:predicted esterase
VAATAQHYGFASDNIVAVGYSNGANIAASMLLLRAEVLPTAILFRGMVPLHPETEPNLSSVRVWIGAGTEDPIIPMSETNALADLLRRAGADVTIRYFQAGHELTMSDVEAARDWLTSFAEASEGILLRAMNLGNTAKRVSAKQDESAREWVNRLN